MRSDNFLPVPARHTVVALADGPLGPRFRVGGLLGQQDLARSIEGAFAPAAGVVRASASTGIVRVDLRRSGSNIDWEAELGGIIDDFGAVAAVRARPPARVPRVPKVLERPTPERRAVAATRAPRPAALRAAARGKAVNVTAPVDAVANDAHALGMAELLERCEASLDGLGSVEAAARLARDGPNELRDITARSNAEILVSQFKSVPVAMLAGSGAVSIASAAYADAGAIGAVLGANATIGYVTERQAEQTVSALRKLAPRSARVLRDGCEVEIPAIEVVVGDVLVLKPGDAVAADARVIESHRLSANEAPLTGESLPVRKEPVDRLAPETPIGERRNLLHLGTVVSGGAGRAVVVATAEHTALGAIRALAQTAEAPRTRLQTELDGLGRKLAIGASALCLGVLAIGLLRGRPALPMLRTAVSLGVAAIPEGLPTVATSLLATGIRTLQKRNVFARRLDAIENLGAVDVVGFDKTGTLTQNRMSVAATAIGGQRVVIRESEPVSLPQDYALVAALCHDVQRANGSGWQGSSTEIALIEFAAACGAPADALVQRHPRLDMKQRSEHHPYMVTLHDDAQGGYLVTVKGRPAEVLERCERWYDGKSVARLTAARRKLLLRDNDELAAAGNRVLALAISRQQDAVLGETAALTWLGLVALADPLRPASRNPSRASRPRASAP